MRVEVGASPMRVDLSPCRATLSSVPLISLPISGDLLNDIFSYRGFP